jgi:hypothetical protein
MYFPALKLSETGVPILSKLQLERIAERYHTEYATTLDPEDYRLDPHRFAEEYLELTLKYQWLSNNGCYLGMAVFRDDTAIPVYVPEQNTAKKISAGKDTILIDRSLQQEYMRNGETFTILHECSHQILHWAYYRRKESVPCRKESVQPAFTPTQWADEDRMEWQANYLASAVLIPLSALNTMIEEHHMVDYYQHRLLRGVSETSAFKQAAMDVGFRFGVSTLMAKIRLQGIDFGKEIRDTISIR